MSFSRRSFLQGSLGAALSRFYAPSATTGNTSGSHEGRAERPPTFGSGSFGVWDRDAFGLPIFRYTAKQSVDSEAVTNVRPGTLTPTEHIHQVGNDRITALASNYGTVRVRQDEGGPKILNGMDPETYQYGGGLGYLTDGRKVLSTYHDGGDLEFERIFGMGYFRKRVRNAEYGIDQVIVAPFGDDPVLLSQVTLTNYTTSPAHLRWVEYWGCQPYQLSLRACWIVEQATFP